MKNQTLALKSKEANLILQELSDLMTVLEKKAKIMLKVLSKKKSSMKILHTMYLVNLKEMFFY